MTKTRTFRRERRIVKATVNYNTDNMSYTAFVEEWYNSFGLWDGISTAPQTQLTTALTAQDFVPITRWRVQ